MGSSERGDMPEVNIDNPKKLDLLQSEVAAFWDAEPCDSENSVRSSDTQDYYKDLNPWSSKLKPLL
jgi:hypothetical protein